MKQKEIWERCEKMREKLAYLRIARGLLLKECASELGIEESAAEYHWDCVKKIIEGRPTPYEERMMR